MIFKFHRGLAPSENTTDFAVPGVFDRKDIGIDIGFCFFLFSILLVPGYPQIAPQTDFRRFVFFVMRFPPPGLLAFYFVSDQ